MLAKQGQQIALRHALVGPGINLAAVVIDPEPASDLAALPEYEVGRCAARRGGARHRGERAVRARLTPDPCHPILSPEYIELIVIVGARGNAVPQLPYAQPCQLKFRTRHVLHSGRARDLMGRISSSPIDPEPAYDV